MNSHRTASKPSKASLGSEENAPVEVDEEFIGPPDDELVERAQMGDPEAFDQLVTRYRGKIYAMIYHLVQNDADAWDLAQDAFVKAWRALPKFQGKSAFYTWLYRISHNVVYDWLRKKANVVDKREFDETFVGDPTAENAPTVPKSVDAPDEEAERHDLRLEIQAALEKLSPEQRETILLREVEGLKYDEIAERMDCSTGTVMSRLFYARKNLQEWLAHTRDRSRH